MATTSEHPSDLEKLQKLIGTMREEDVHKLLVMARTLCDIHKTE